MKLKNPIPHSISGSRIVLMNWTEIKEKAISRAITQTKKKITSLKDELVALNASSETDTKSSMGDKYETGREMIQQEKGKISSQLAAFENQLQLVEAISSGREVTSKMVKAGSLVVTNKANYLLSAPIGLIKTNPAIFFLSPVAPIAQSMLGLKKGEGFTFNNQDFQIQEVI